MNLKDILTDWRSWFGGQSTAKQNPEPPLSPLKESSELPDFEDDDEFVLHWVTKSGPKRHVYEFLAGDRLIWSEEAMFEWTSEAFRTLKIIVQKYDGRISMIHMDPLTGIYVGGDSTSGWERFLDDVERLGFREVHQEIVKEERNGYSEIVLQGTVFVSRRNET